MNFSKEQKDYIIHALEHCEVLTGGRSSGKTLELIKQQNKEIERLHSIIKEVRRIVECYERIEGHYTYTDSFGKEIETFDDTTKEELLEILGSDKE